MEDPPLPFVEDAEPGCEDGAVLRYVVLMLFGADRLERIQLLPVVAPTPRRERQRRIGPAGLERFENLFLFHSRPLGELGDRRRAAELHRQLLHELRQLHIELLETARDANGPALVAEMALDLPDDVWRRVRGQLDATVDVEAVDRLDQSDRADLDEVFELLAAI